MTDDQSNITDNTFDPTDDTVPSDQQTDAIQDDGLFQPADVPRLAEDGATPSAPPTDVPGPEIPLDHPATDTNADSDEVYHNGLANASEVTEQHYESDAVERPADDEPASDLEG